MVPPPSSPLPPPHPLPIFLWTLPFVATMVGGHRGGAYSAPNCRVWELVELLVLSGCFLRGTMMSLDLDSLCVWWLFSCSVVSNSP